MTDILILTHTDHYTPGCLQFFNGLLKPAGCGCCVNG